MSNLPALLSSAPAGKRYIVVVECGDHTHNLIEVMTEWHLVDDYFDNMLERIQRGLASNPPVLLLPPDCEARILEVPQ